VACLGDMVEKFNNRINSDRLCTVRTSEFLPSTRHGISIALAWSVQKPDRTLHRPPALPTVLSRAPAHVHHHTHLLLDVASLRGRNQTRDRAHARLCHVIQGTDTERIGILLGLLHEVGAQVGGAGSRIYRERSYTRSPSRHGKIVVEKLTKNVNEAHLREIFGSYGQIESLDMPMNR
jgi:hypothetical protein